MARRDDQWRLPALWRYEFLNVLATLVRAGHTDAQSAQQALLDAIARHSPSEVSCHETDVLSTAARLRISGYDAWFIQVAEDLQVPCITEDAKLRRAAPHCTLSMNEFLSRRT